MLDYRRKLFLGVAKIESVFADTLGNVRPGMGTGFWMCLASGKNCFVTNRHNIDPAIKFPKNPDFSLQTLKIELRRRIITEDGEPTYDAKTQFFELTDNSKLLLSENSDCAIAMADFKTPDEDFPVCAPFEESDLATEDFFQTTLTPAHEVYFIGFAGRGADPFGEKAPQYWWDTKWNFPIARAAVVASMPFLQFNHKDIGLEDVLLVSGMSFSGSSGSPVISREIGFRTKPPARPGGPAVQCEGYASEKLIGIMTGHWRSESNDPDIFEHSGLSYITRSTSILHLIKYNAL
jgi:hypothetical protein